MKKSLILFILFLLVPNVGHAENFERFSNKLLVNTNESQYRLRATTVPFQLLSFPGTVKDQFVSGDISFVIVENNNKKYLFSSTDGLSYAPTSEINNQFIENYTLNPKIVLTTNQSVYLVNEGEIQRFPIPEFNPEVAHIFTLASKYFYLTKEFGQTRLLQQNGNSWQEVDQLICDTTNFYALPVATVLCNNEIFQISPQGFEQLAEGAKFLANSEQVSVLQSESVVGKFYIITIDNLIEIETGLLDPVTFVHIFADRIIIQSQQLYELQWQTTGEINQLPVTSGQLAGLEKNRNIYLYSPSQSWRSSQENSWQPITVVAPFNRVDQASNKTILWQAEGADVQVSTDGINFQLQNGSWARSAKLKAITEFNSELFLFLLNSSNAPNLYRNSSNIWTRITLPTQATFPLTIAQARSAAAETLVELKGIITAGQGVVSAETFYLQDESGGIQIFLSKSKGALAEIINKNAIVTAEISSSQTKRAIMDRLEDIEIGLTANQVPLAITLSDAANSLGLKVRFSGLVDKVSTDYFSIVETAQLLKVHWQKSKEKLSSSDKTEVTAIIDWNSSSDAVESWVINDLVIVTPAQLKTEDEATITAVKKSTSLKPKTTTSTKNTSPVTVASASKKVTNLLPEGSLTDSQSTQAATIPLLVQYLIIAVGILTVTRGTRTKKYFS